MTRAANPAALNAAAPAAHRLGHVPVVGANMAPPIVAAAGDDDAADEGAMTPLSLAPADRCGARPRIGGASGDADAGVARSMAAGRPVSRRIVEIPKAVRP